MPSFASTDAIGDRQHVFAIAIPVLVARTIIVRDSSVGPELDPINRQTLRDASSAVDDQKRPSVSRVVGWSVGSKPVTAAQRRIDDERPLCLDGRAASVDGAVRKRQAVPELGRHRASAVKSQMEHEDRPHAASQRPLVREIAGCTRPKKATRDLLS